MGKFRERFLLKQNTPIWHFQHSQDNATLRATEVKPKLDRFLLANKSTDIEKEWFLKDSSQSLDYKLFIHTEEVPDKPKESTCPQFFGNTGSKKLPSQLAVSRKKALFFKKNIFLEVFSQYPELIKLIEGCLLEFFFVHNFGTRQSKGYGSFSYIGKDGSSDEICCPVSEMLNKRNIFNERNAVEITVLSSFRVESGNYTNVLNAIDLFYKSIRGGILGKMNPILSDWVLEKNLKWDKEVLADLFKPVNGRVPDKNVNESTDFLYRDYLGLAVDMRPWRGRMTKSQSGDDKIKRFKSPVFIKPVREDKGYRVYIGYNNTVDELDGKKFKVTFNKNGSKKYKIIQMYPSFKLDEYLKYCIMEGERLVKRNCKIGKEKSELIVIYSELNKAENKKWEAEHI